MSNIQYTAVNYTPTKKNMCPENVVVSVNSSMSRVFDNGSGIALQFFSADISKIHKLISSYSPTSLRKLMVLVSSGWTPDN